MHFKRPKGRRALSSRRVTAPYLPWVRPKMTRRPTPEDGGPFAFVTPGSGGLKGPIGLVFGPNGDLFTGSFGDRVLEDRCEGRAGRSGDAVLAEICRRPKPACVSLRRHPTAFRGYWFGTCSRNPLHRPSGSLYLVGASATSVAFFNSIVSPQDQEGIASPQNDNVTDGILAPPRH